MINIKHKLREYCADIEIEYLDDLSLERSGTAPNAEELVSFGMHREIHSENVDELLFVMYHLYSLGHGYYHTLGLCDTMNYGSSGVADLYRQLTSRLYLRSYKITRDMSQFNCVVVKGRICEQTHPLSRLQVSVFKLLNAQKFNRDRHTEVLSEIQVLKRLYESKPVLLQGFTRENALHGSIGHVPQEIPTRRVHGVLCDVESHLATLFDILDAKDVNDYCYDNLEKVTGLPVMYRAFLSTVLGSNALKSACMDFRPFRDSLYSTYESPLENHKKLVFYLRYLKIHRMVTRGQEMAFEWLLSAYAAKFDLCAGIYKHRSIHFTKDDLPPNDLEIISDFCSIYNIDMAISKA